MRDSRFIRPDIPASLDTTQAPLPGSATLPPSLPSSDLKAAPEINLTEDAFRTLIQNAPFGVYRSSVEGRLLLVNPALVEILGYASAEELLERNLDRDIYLNPTVRRRAVGEFWHNKNYWDFEADWKRKDGSVIRVRLTGRGYHATKDDPIYFEIFVEDISERSELERQLVQAQKMEAVGQLAGGIAHDFNNLLGMILAQAELFKEETSPEDPRLARIQAIHQGASRAAALTRKLLAFSRKQQVEPRIVDINCAVRDFEKLLRDFIGDKIEFSLRLSPAAASIRIDPVQLEQILMNLVVNARDAMPNGGKLVIETSLAEYSEAEARHHVGSRPGRFVLVTVTDAGIGMDKATMARIFEPFFTTKPPGKGTGLGLSTTYGIVRQCGGFIVPSSEPGHGTTFRIYFPYPEDSTPAILPDKAAAAPTGGCESILLVEDEPGMREITRELLTAGGYCVLEAENYSRAIDLAEKTHVPIHLLLTDLMMPGMDGHTLATRLRSILPDLRVLFMSGYSDDLLTHHASLVNDSRVLRKPFSRSDLLERVRRALGNS
ncbi:MAG TPA: ATP-binding protein [Verrucomicrobiae bacterium]|nr:ATP-binding protein [Verrucomicrobiae bacterium]